jgi:hypothetical protein
VATRERRKMKEAPTFRIERKKLRKDEPFMIIHQSRVITRRGRRKSFPEPGAVKLLTLVNFMIEQYLCAYQVNEAVKQLTACMGEIEKVGCLKSQNLSIKNRSIKYQYQKSHIGSVKISPFRMKKFEIRN